MKEINLNTFADAAIETIHALEESQSEAIDKAAQVLAQAIQNGGVIHVFGSGHSWGFGIEISGKPGTLVPVHLIQTSDFVTKGLVPLEEFKDRDNIFERRPGMANRLYDLYNIQADDAFIVISNSGINGLVIDMAQKARDNGHPVIIITSMKHTSAENSRHPSGKKLYELGDIVIDNCGPYGDALLETDGVAKICSISSITGGIIAHQLGAKIAQYLLDAGVEDLPYLRYDDEAKNAALLKAYEGRI